VKPIRASISAYHKFKRIPKPFNNTDVQRFGINQYESMDRRPQRALGNFLPLKKVPKIDAGQLIPPLFWGGFGPEKQLFGWVLGTK
jgi:hypothetical protein